MVTQLRPAPHWTELLGQALGQGVSGGFEGYQQGRQSLAEQQTKEQQAQYLREQGIDPRVLDQPTGIQNQLLKNLLRSNTWSETAQNIASVLPGVSPVSRPGMQGPPQQQQQQMMNINGQQVPVGAFSSGTQDALQLVQAEDQQQYNTTGRNIGSTATAFGLPAALNYLSYLNPQLGALLSAGSAIDLGLQGTNWLGKKLGAQGNIVPTYQELQENKLPAAIEEQIKRKAGGNEAFEKYLRKNAQQNILQALPTFSQAKEGITQAGEAIGLPLEAKTEGQKKASNIAELAGFALSPQTWSGSLGSIAKNIGKAFTAATGIKLGGSAVKQLTGSETAGALAEGGLFALYSLFPGTFSSMSQKRFDDVNNVINQADEAGMVISGRDLQSKFQNLEDTVKKHLAEGSEAKKWMDTQLAESNALFKAYRELTPSQLNNQTQASMQLYNDVPAQARKYHQSLIDLERELLGNNLNKVKSGTGNALKEAYNLAHTNYAVNDKIGEILNSASPRKNALAAGALFGGGYRQLVAGAAAASGYTYLKKFFSNPTVQSSMKQLAKASASNNVQAMNAVMNKLDKQIQITLKKLPKKEREEVERVLKQSTIQA